MIQKNPSSKKFSFFFLISLMIFLEINITLAYDLKCRESDSEDLKLGKSVILCIHILEKGVRVAAPLEIDEYSVVSIKDIYSSVVNNTNITFVAQIGDVTSVYSAHYVEYNNENSYSRIFPMLNLVVKMEEGNIYEIVWDNDCFNCDKKNCMELQGISIFNSSDSLDYKNCFEEEINCFGGSNSTDTNEALELNSCEPKFYVTWFGTDKNKRQLKTSGMAMSKFKHYSIKSLYSSIQGLFSSKK